MLGGWRGVNALIGHHTGLYDFQGGVRDAVLVIAVTQPGGWTKGLIRYEINIKSQVAKFNGIENIRLFIKISKSYKKSHGLNGTEKTIEYHKT